MSDLMPREAVRRMAAYRPPTAGREAALRLDFNENTVGCSPAVVAALRDLTTVASLTTYPEYGAARQDLAGFFGVAAEEMLLTNGSDEAIQLLVNTFVDAGDEVLLLTPSYAMYRFYAELAGGVIREVAYRQPTLDPPIDALLAAIRPETKAIFLANPNNPTGLGVSPEVIRTILEQAPGTAVLIDEAYAEFSGVTVLPLIREHRNLFVCRTFSKAYGMAALRLGCLFSHAGNTALLQKAQSPYSVNALAVIAARAAVADREYLAGYVAQVMAARELLINGLAVMGFQVYPSQANFVLVKVGARATALCGELRHRGVLVRDRSHELDGCLRITCGTPDQAQRVLEEIAQLW